jgi:hypothetical protein
MISTICRAYELTDQEQRLFSALLQCKEAADASFLAAMENFNSYWVKLAPQIDDGEKMESQEVVQSPQGRIIILTKSRKQ